MDCCIDRAYFCNSDPESVDRVTKEFVKFVRSQVSGKVIKTALTESLDHVPTVYILTNGNREPIERSLHDFIQSYSEHLAGHEVIAGEISEGKSISESVERPDVSGGIISDIPETSSILGVDYKVLGMDNKDSEQIFREMFSIVDRSLADLVNSGGKMFYFDITYANPVEAFTVCKISAVFPLYVVSMDPVFTVLPNFPSYYEYSDVEKMLSEEIYRHRSVTDSANRLPKGYVASSKLAKAVGKDTKNRYRLFEKMLDRGLLRVKETHSGRRGSSEKAFSLSESGLLLHLYSGWTSRRSGKD